MQAIVIADGINKEFLSTEQRFVNLPENVGRLEIDRLLGRGKAYGSGPLAAFLAAVAEDFTDGGATRLVVLRGDSAVPEVLDPVMDHATVLMTAPDVIPWQELEKEIKDQIATGGAGGDDTPLHFLIVGCHTERRILGLATYLRTVLGFTKVAVSPHLVGSATQAAHFAAFRHNFPSAKVEVLLDLKEVAAYAGLDPSRLADVACSRPEIGPKETRDNLTEPQRRILELLCLNWTRAEMRPLAGGYSGSLLLLAQGWKGRARTEPMVLKVDEFAQMRRELDGYHQVKDFFGKHVPTFGYPVADAESIGVGMELAAMEGNPRTLQETFEAIETDEALKRFLRRLDKALALLSDKLYRNTSEFTWVVPYRAFGLHTEKQVGWLVQNSEYTLSYLGEEIPAEGRVDPEQLGKLLRLIATNPDGIDSEMCIVHGDLNYANIICDEGDNIWFIDWTHCGYLPVELDFAKLESDVKFVMSKAFDAADLPRLRLLEEYLLEQRIPAEPNEVPERIKFAKWDLRFRRILEAVRRIRQACFVLKQSDEWLIYRVALLRYATHNLSFDKRRGRGECEPPQLMHALYSVEALIYNLVGDDFHLKTRSERPATYPPRQRVSIDEAPWMLDCDGYSPPYHVDPLVLENDRTKADSVWADPEDFAQVRNDAWIHSVKFKDEGGRPLNPRGRTGIAGRGLLGLWGPNLSVAALVVRRNPDAEHLEILLGSVETSTTLEVPKGFVLPEETAQTALLRVLDQEANWRPVSSKERIVFEGYTYDPRQTDNAWVESCAFLVFPEDSPALFKAGGEFDQIKWYPLEAEAINRVPTGQARFIRDSIPELVNAGHLDEAGAEKLLTSTG